MVDPVILPHTGAPLVQQPAAGVGKGLPHRQAHESVIPAASLSCSSLGLVWPGPPAWKHIQDLPPSVINAFPECISANLVVLTWIT